MTLRETLAVIAEHQWNMAETGGSLKIELVVKPELTWRGLEQVSASNYLAYCLVGVINGDREVVGEVTVVAKHHEIIESLFNRATNVILKTDPGTTGANPKRRGPAARAPLLTLGIREIPAGARVSTLGQLTVRGGSSLPYLGPGTEALVQESFGIKLFQGPPVEPVTPGLSGRITIPVDSDQA